jgi:sterol desaturase/sphingolipid hydroxylase (fatty acid hydroxylase superfamily)
LIELLAKHPALYELVISTLIGLGVYAVCALIVIAAELSHGGDLRIYRTRSALIDLAYAVFYKCSIYNVLVFPLYALLVPRLQFLRVNALAAMPAVWSVLLGWLIFDFLNYWTHRMQHAISPLWAFHSVHHTQTHLTFLSANRIHAFEQLYIGVLMLVPAFLLGIPQPRWLPILFVQIFSETLQHAQLDWSFGPLRRLFVSPVTHAIHHSAEGHQYNANYGRVLAVWDVLFGTYVFERGPRRFGVDGMDVPDRLGAQFIHPFRLLAARWIAR